MKRYGLIGYPLSHSFSKKFFNEKFEKEGLIDYTYDLFAIKSVEEIHDLLTAFPDLKGLNVTIPHKQHVLAHLYSPAQIPDGIMACNCIRIEDGKLFGYNTDIIGFEKSFLTHLRPYHQKALVLGNGGATAAVTYVLGKFGIPYQIVSRTLHDYAALTYEDLNEEIIRDNLIIINTTPLGTFPQTETCPAIPYDFLSSRHYLFDLVYNPEKTLFLQKGEQKGATVKNGYEMLLIQAEESWKIWTS